MLKGNALLGLAAAGLITSGCGKSTAEPVPDVVAQTAARAVVALPSDPVERAATCSGAYLAVAQLKPGFEQNGISEDEMNRVMHPVYVDAGASGRIEQARLELAGNKSPIKAAEFRKNGNAQATITACEAAYPAVRAGSFKTLPTDPAEARMACVATAGALVQTYQATEEVRSERLPEIARLMEQLTEPVFADFERKGVTDAEAMNAELRAVLARTMRSGPPGEVMTACLARFGAQNRA